MQKYLATPVWLLGILLIFTILGPYFLANNQLSSNEVLSPLNDQYHSCGDNRYYFSFVRELKENFFYLNFPISEEVHKASFDTFRAGVYRLLYLLGGFISDSRIGFICSYFLSIFLGSILFYFISRNFGLSKLSSFLITTIITYLYPLISNLPQLNTETTTSYFKFNFLNIDGRMFLEAFNSNFRYAILAGVMPFVWGMFYVLTKRLKKYLNIIVICLMLVSIQYTYLPITIYLDIYLFFFVVFLWKKSFNEYATEIGIAIFAAIFIFISLGGIGNITTFLSNFPRVVSESHLAPKLFYGLNDLTFVLLTIIAPPALFFFRRRMFTSIEAIFFYSQFSTYTVIAIALSTSGNMMVFYRFYERGLGIIWAAVICVLIFCILERSIKILNYLRAVAYIGVIFLSGAILNSAWKTSESMNEVKSFSISKERWNSYQFINENIPANKVFFATSYTDIQLLPVYTDQDLFVGGAEYSEAPEISLFNYLSGINYIAENEINIISWLETYDYFESRSTCSPSKKSFSWRDSFGYETLKQIVYDPYIKTFDGGFIRDGNRLSEKFKMKALNIYEKSHMSRRDFLSKKVQYILVAPPFAVKNITGFNVIFKEGNYSIFEKAK